MALRIDELDADRRLWPRDALHSVALSDRSCH